MTTATDPLTSLLSVLDLRPAPSGTNGVEVFLGTNQPSHRPRVFGGQVVAQALVAASRSVPTERPVHSLHGYFLRPGNPDLDITFAVERLHEGRSFTTRRVQASQAGKAIFSMIASFQAEQEGLEHARDAPDVPAPEDLPSTSEVLADLDHPMARYWASQRPVDVRHVEGPLHLAPGASAAPATDGVQHVWMRVDGTLPDSPALHRAVLAYLSDIAALEPTLRAHGVAWTDDGLRAASLDHALWIHRPFRADEWLLFVQDSPSASGARGLNLCRIHRRDGTLVATMAQEGMVRLV